MFETFGTIIVGALALVVVVWAAVACVAGALLIRDIFKDT